MKLKIAHSRGFTLVELIIGMTIFAMGMTSIFILLQSTMKNMVYSRNEVVVANLLREELELARNMRNSNISMYAPWDKIPAGKWEEGIYTIENQFGNSEITFDSDGKITSAPIKITKITDFTVSDADNFDKENLKKKFKASQLYFDDKNRYTHEETDKPTVFASYLAVRPLKFENNGTSTAIEKKIEHDDGTI